MDKWDSLPPQQRAELEILRGMYHLPEVRRGASIGLESILFTNPKFKEVFEVLRELTDQNVLDQQTYILAAQKLNFDPDSWALIGKEIPQNKEVLTNYFRIIREEGGRNAIINLAEKLKSRAQSNETQTVELAKQARHDLISIEQASTPINENATPMKSLVKHVIDQIGNTMEGKPSSFDGLPTGFPDIDKLTSGLHQGITLVSARPYASMSDFALSIALNVSIPLKDKNSPTKRVVSFSGHTSEQVLVNHSLSSLSNVNFRNIREGFLGERDFPRLTSAAGKLVNSKLIFYDKLKTASEVYKQILFESRKGDLGLVIIDRFQNFVPPVTDYKQTDLQMREHSIDTENILLRSSIDFKVPLLVLCEMSSDAEKRAKSTTPRLGDIRSYGTLVYDSHPVIMLHRKGAGLENEDYQNDDPANEVIAYIENNPFGVGRSTANLTHLKDLHKYESAAKISDADES